MTTSTKPGLLKVVQYSAGAVAALVIVQALMGAGVVISEHTFKDAHGGIGMLTAACAAVCTVASFMWKGQGGNPGLVGHSIATAVLCLAQVGLGYSEVRGVHIGLGFLILVAGVALAAIAFNKPTKTAA